MRYALPLGELNLDPAQGLDPTSRTVSAAIFEAPLQFEFMARPLRLRANTAARMPEVSADHKTFTFEIKPGIYFADDPAFKGQQRELTAEDYVFSIKRYYDPRWRSPLVHELEAAGLLGLSALRARALASKQPFDYDTPVAGLRALDRYRFQIRLAQSAPRFLYNFTDGASMGAVAREVVMAYGDALTEHPVGTGPFRLQSWQHGRSVTLVRNTSYRDVRYAEHPAAEDSAGLKAAARLRGRRLPLIDRVTIDFVDTAQGRWLAFLNQEHGLVEDLPADYVQLVSEGGLLAPGLQRRGVQRLRYPRLDVVMSCFNMGHPMVGGMAAERVALRRAISLGLDVAQEVRLLRHGQAVVAQSLIAPGVQGHDPALKSEMGDFSVARARALLDLYGYADRNGDGWREQPDGAPLVLRYALAPDTLSRQLAEHWRRNLAAIGLRIEFDIAAPTAITKASRAGSLMMWMMTWRAGSPDGEDFLDLGYAGQIGSANRTRFDLPTYNALYEEQSRLPDGPQRAAAMRAAEKLWLAYLPCKVHVHRIATDLAQSWLLGYQRNPFVRDFWKYVDIDTAGVPR